MAISGLVGQTAHLTASDLDAAGAADPNAVESWTETDVNGQATSSGFIGTPSATGPLTVDVSLVASGTAYVVATATDPDGNTVSSQPFAIQVLAATDTATVTVSGTVS